MTQLETVWQRVDLRGRLGWEALHAPEDPDMQLYAAWKYPRADIEALRPGPLIRTARAVTPDMLQVRVGGCVLLACMGRPQARGWPWQS
jgi:hypothetical protein